MRIAELRENVTFKATQEVSDGQGGAIVSLVDILTTRAMITPLTGTRTLEGSQQTYPQTYDLVIRKRQGFVPEGGMHIDYRGRLLIVSQAVDMAEDHRFQQIRAITKDSSNG